MARWVPSSVTLPLQARNWTGTVPSRATVRMKSNCLRSGRWSLLCPQVIAGVGFPRRVVSSAA